MELRGGRLAALILAFGLRVFGLGSQELRGDEAFGYFFSLRPFADMIDATLALQEPHPVGSYFVQRIWIGWAGETEFALRYSGLLTSVLAVALLMRLAARLNLHPRAGLMGGLLLAASPYAIWHAQDARMYNLSLALTLLSTLLMVEALQRGRRRLWSGYALMTLAALHVHYFAIFVVAAQNLFVVGRWLWTRRMGINLAQWIQVQVVVGFFYLPWLLAVQETLTGYQGNVDSPGALSVVQRSLSVFAVGESVPESWRTVAALIGAGLLLWAGWGMARGGPAQRRNLWLLGLLLVVPLAATWFSARSRPIFDERYLIAAAPPFYLLLGIGLERLLRAGRRGRTIGALLSLVMVAALISSFVWQQTDPRYSKDRGWRELAVALEQWSAGMEPEQVRIAQNFPDPTLWYYYRGAVDHLVLPPAPHDGDGAAHAVAALLEAGVDRVILPVQPAAWWDGEGLARQALAGRYPLVAEQSVGVWPVAVYHRPGALTGLGIGFVNGVQLAGVDVAPRVPTPGGLLAVHLDWQGDAPDLIGDEKVFIHLLDDQERIIGQADIPFHSVIPQSYGILLPTEWSSPPRLLVAGLYRPEHGRILTEDGRDRVMLFGVYKSD